MRYHSSIFFYGPALDATRCAHKFGMVLVIVVKFSRELKDKPLAMHEMFFNKDANRAIYMDLSLTTHQKLFPGLRKTLIQTWLSMNDTSCRKVGGPKAAAPLLLCFSTGVELSLGDILTPF